MMEKDALTLVRDVRNELERQGFAGAEFVSSAAHSTAYEVAIFRIGPLLVRVVQERGQRFVDIGAQSEPTRFYQFDDVEIAMGWRSVDDVLAKEEPDPIELVLHRILANLDVLTDAFAPGEEQLTRSRIDRAADRRGQAFMARLRSQ
jgi:hypothetical protein